MLFLNHRPAKAPGFTRVAAYAALLTLAGPALAANMVVGTDDDAIRAIVVRDVDRQPKTEAGARRLLRRLGDAAMEACGGSPFSLAPVKAAIRNSQCWHDSVTRAVNQVDDRLVTEAFQRSLPSRAG